MNGSVLDKISCIIVAGGIGTSNVEALTGFRGTKHLQNLPREINGSTLVPNNGTILCCGGAFNRQTCLQLDLDTWKEHSVLNERRRAHSSVATKTATFVFGGTHSRSTYEYRLKDSTTWLLGKTRIPGCFQYSCAILSESENEIWLIGDSTVA